MYDNPLQSVPYPRKIFHFAQWELEISIDFIAVVGDVLKAFENKGEIGW
jgi:hypothetical protein